MRPEPLATGWDVGGAHLKVAQADATGRLHVVAQVPCRLWLGLEELEAALALVRPCLAPSDHHGVTMTGELVDLFADRAEGVRRLTGAMVAALPGADLRLYAGPGGFVRPGGDQTPSSSWPDTQRHDDSSGGDVGHLADERAANWPAGEDQTPSSSWPDTQRHDDSSGGVGGHLAAVASANWHATARWLAGRLPAGLLVDVGSTTTDVVPFADGEVRATGHRDHERMIADELVYTGVTRTPVMAMAVRVPFAGAEQPLMAELFATAADVHRLTGDLPADADQHPTADGRGRGLGESAARLARMLGRDGGDAPLAQWRALAAHLTGRQAEAVAAAVARVAARAGLDAAAPLVGAGVGRFLVPGIASGLGRPYRDLATLVEGSPQTREAAARCAPAAAIALLTARTLSA